MKSLTTGFYSGLDKQHTQNVSFYPRQNQINLQTFADQMNIKNFQGIAQNEFNTAYREVQSIETSVHSLKHDILMKTKDTILIKNEVRRGLIDNKNPTVQDIVTHYIDKLRADYRLIVKTKEEHNQNLQ